MTNSKGQAAVADALYFLAIVSGIVVFLFAFIPSYGSDINDKVLTQYRLEYARSALKTILYSSTPRDPSQSLETAKEIDYLLAALKEDYADDDKFNTSKNALVNTIDGIMEPIANNFDYLFYIYLPDKEEVALAYMHTRGFVLSAEGRTVGVESTSTPYECTPDGERPIKRLTQMLGSNYLASTRMDLIKLVPGSVPSRIKAQATLILWVPTAFPKIDNQEATAYLKCKAFP